MGINFYIEQFKTELHDVYKAYRFSHLGLYHMYETIKKMKAQNNLENFRIQDQELDVDILFSDEEIHKASEYGFYQKIIAGNTISMFYNLWEDNYRSIFAQIQKIKPTDIRNDFFGDLGKIRNSITHKHYQRSSEINKLKVLQHLFPDNKFDLTSYEVHTIYKTALNVLEALKH